MSDESPATGTNVNATLFNSKIEEEAGKVVGVIFGGAAEGAMSVVGNIFGGLIGDRVREWRTQNLVARMAETAKILKEKGISLDKAKAIPMGEAYAMFEESSKQDDPTVGSMWSALLANAMDADANVGVDPSFIATLRVLGGPEARLLKFIHEFEKLETKLRPLKPQFDFFVDRTRPDQLEAAHRVKMEQFVAESIQKKQALISENIGDLENRRIESAITLLLKERCICIHVPEVSGSDLMCREIEEAADADKVADAINEIATVLAAQIGQEDTELDLYTSDKLNASINYAIQSMLLVFYTLAHLSSLKPN